MIKTLTATSESPGYLRKKLGAEVHLEVVLRRDQTGRVVHFDLQVGKRIQQRRVGHRDFVGDVVKGVHRPAVHGGRVCQVRGRRQQISWNQKKKKKTEGESCRGKEAGDRKGKARWVIGAVDLRAERREMRAANAADKPSASGRYDPWA